MLELKIGNFRGNLGGKGVTLEYGKELVVFYKLDTSERECISLNLLINLETPCSAKLVF